MWRNEPAKVKAHYKKLADLEKTKHQLQHPNYKCSPRKSSEIQKRKRSFTETLTSTKATLPAATALQLSEDISQRLFSEYEEVDDLLTLPLPSAEVLAQQVQVDPADITVNTAELGFNLTPHPSATEDDTSFFPDIVDDHDPAFLAIVAEVGEAFEAGYYDDEVTAAPSADPIPSYPADYNYELTDYYD